jgi:hypothetical protein
MEDFHDAELLGFSTDPVILKNHGAIEYCDGIPSAFAAFRL